jgi:hypothetical protein
MIFVCNRILYSHTLSHSSCVHLPTFADETSQSKSGSIPELMKIAKLRYGDFGSIIIYPLIASG